MTQSEKKATQSEKLSESNNSLSANMLELGTLMYFTVLKGRQRFNFISPIEGYLNLLILDDSANCTIQIQQETYLLNAGDNLLIHLNKADLFDLKSICLDNRILLMLIPSDKLLAFHDKYITDKNRFQHGLLTKADARIELSLQQIFDLYEADSYINQLKIQSLLLEIIIHQVESLYVENENKEIIVNKNHYDKIQMAKKLIDEDLSKNHTISDLAKSVGTNEQYLKKHFKQFYGKTIMNYITEMKMEHAKKLILMGKYRISDVARMTGYKHSTHFTTAFKKYFGIIPNSLRYTFLIAHEGVQALPDILNNIHIF
ncbi:helix-turn-helix transcriptional regulator [Sphingobacterium sp. WM]|uniref:AraC family transcriptional regulator n=1 Tax=Sphingobacterium sp. WM TaxID=3031802 RepID=UPI00240E66ED|nr:helix-turn-helix domain-containing protein [Sphingobacterium sp. WM]WFB63728.1 helix-turn-helix transcriptional regulator [Sphingobacterium sp. WM]